MAFQRLQASCQSLGAGLRLGTSLNRLLSRLASFLSLFLYGCQAFTVFLALFNQGLAVRLGVLLASLPLLLERLGPLLGLLLRGLGASLGHRQGALGLDAGLIGLLGLTLSLDAGLALLVALLLEGLTTVAGLGQLLPGVVALGL